MSILVSLMFFVLWTCRELSRSLWIKGRPSWLVYNTANAMCVRVLVCVHVHVFVYLSTCLCACVSFYSLCVKCSKQFASCTAMLLGIACFDAWMLIVYMYVHHILCPLFSIVILWLCLVCWDMGTSWQIPQNAAHMWNLIPWSLGHPVVMWCKVHTYKRNLVLDCDHYSN